MRWIGARIAAVHEIVLHRNEAPVASGNGQDLRYSPAARCGVACHADNGWELLCTFASVACVRPCRWAGCKGNAVSCACIARAGRL